MSLLSSTQGTPERVWSLVGAIAANGGELPRSDAQEWLNPGHVVARQEVSEKATTFGQTLGAATSLGAVHQEGGLLRLDPSCSAATFADFCDWVHDRLVGLGSHEKDAVVLETYAYVAAESHRQGSLAFVHEWTAKSFADEADKALPEGADDDGERRINPTKLPTWRRWLDCIGLSLTLPGVAQSHPSADARLTRELPGMGAREDLTTAEIPAEVFLQHLARRLPYLDGGHMFAQTARRIGHVAGPRQLSPLLSASLRNLHDDGVLELRLRGDAGTVTRLWPEPTHRVQTFHAVYLPEMSA
ncbi:hypothetical protein A3862_29695 (plasmid) [Methylobacterium sp. XJLW]|uniref:hypothetical protein n=1 Tax=Methylobacterium sp. XJLW TaxID=739141 RepID=UPI000DAAD830|nr:hypothetical protein [Methylobacterium sp. XJLW]AWV19817.1 hypothetical protein A3862_29695 [Methylobacterium sp. XJLW]